MGRLTSAALGGCFAQRTWFRIISIAPCFDASCFCWTVRPPDGGRACRVHRTTDPVQDHLCHSMLRRFVFLLDRSAAWRRPRMEGASHNGPGSGSSVSLHASTLRVSVGPFGRLTAAALGGCFAQRTRFRIISIIPCFDASCFCWTVRPPDGGRAWRVLRATGLVRDHLYHSML